MICAYAADAADFTNNGLGPLHPIECTVSETLNGMWEMTLIHAIDGEKSARLAIGNIIRAPVPAGFTPAVKYGGGTGGGKEIYNVTTGGMRLYLRAEPSQTAKGLHAYRPNTEVTVLDKTAGGGKWYEVITPDGRHGYMWAENLTYVRTEGSAEAAAESIREAKALRDQPFRIYKIVPGLDCVTVYARHIFYDLADNLLGSCKIESQTGAAAAAAILSNCRGEAGAFRIYSDLNGEISADWSDKTPVEAIFGSEGLTELTGGEIARDWWDIYAVKRVGRESGVTVRQGKNLKSLGGELNISDVATRIVPIGTDADGSALYLPEGYIDSALIDSYPLIKWARLDVREAKEVKSGKNKRTKEECYELMRAAARERFDSGCDGAAYTLDIDFVNLADTDEYAAYAGVSDLALGDSVRVISPAAGVDVAMRLTDYVYDCLAKRYKSVSLGALSATIASNTLSARQLPTGGVTGAKIAPGAVGARALQDGAVGSLKIALAAINYAHINQAAINQLSADSLTAQIAHINALTAGTVDTDKLTAAWAKLYTIIAENIEAGTIEAGTITAAMAKLSGASIQRADIDFAQIRQLKTGTAVADQLITHDAVADRYFIDKLQVRALQVLEQTVGSLIVKAKDGGYYRLDIDPGAGTVVPTPVSPSGGEKAAGVTGDMSRCIIETDLTVADLAASSIKAINALIDRLTASRIEVDTLFAREATVGALNAYLMKAETITALEGQLNVWAAEKINLAVGALAIGGTNLALNTDTLNADKTVAFGAPAAGSTTIYNTYDGAEYSAQHAIRVNFTAGGTGANIYWHPSYSPALLNGHTYTWQIKAYIADKASGLDVDMGLEAGGLVLKHLSWSWHAFSHTFVYDSSSTYKAFHLNGNFSAGVKVFLADFKIEEGTKASAWTRNPDEQNQIKIGSSILMDAEHTEISTPYLDIDVSGTDGDTHIDENGISTGTASFEKLNCPEIVKRVAGRNITITSPSGLQAEFDRLNGGMVDGYETITLACDQYGDVTLRGMYGNYTNLTINGGYAINGKVTVVDCHAALINFDNLTINCTTKETVAVHNSSYVRFGDCTLNSSSTHDGIVLYGGAMVMMYNCGIYNAANALNLDWGSRLDFLKLKGTATTYLWAKGCVITGNDSRPSGNYVGQNVISNWSDMATIAIDTGSGVTPPAAVTTSSYTATTTGTYYPSGHWIGDNIIRQGYEGTGSSARKDYGCMWFNAGGLAGKTIKSATLTIKRIAGKGRSGSVTMKLWTTALTGKSGKPTDSLVSMGEIGTIANGETVTVSVPTSAIATIAAGGGLVLYTEETTNKTGKTYSENYAHFEGVGGAAPVLAVTYQ